MQPYSLNPFCTAEKRIIYFDASQEMLYRVDAEKGELIEKLVLEYCSQPRTHGEIHRFLKRPHWAIDITIKNIIKPLLKQVKLKVAYRGTEENGAWVRYICSGKPLATEEAILKFCEKPKSKEEIVEYFQVPSNAYYLKYIWKLVRCGKLFLTMPNSTMGRAGQKLTIQVSSTPLYTDSAISRFCETPKTLKEVCEYFDLEPMHGRVLLNGSAKKGIIIKTKKTYSEGCKYIKAKK